MSGAAGAAPLSPDTRGKAGAARTEEVRSVVLVVGAVVLSLQLLRRIVRRQAYPAALSAALQKAAPFIFPFLATSALGLASAAVSYALWWLKGRADRLRFTTVRIQQTSKAFAWLSDFLSRHQSLVEQEPNLDLHVGAEATGSGDHWWLNMFFGKIGQEDDNRITFKPSAHTWNHFVIDVPSDRSSVDGVASFQHKQDALKELYKQGKVQQMQIIIEPYEDRPHGENAKKEVGFRLRVNNPPLWQIWRWGSTDEAMYVVRWFFDWNREQYVHREKDRTQLHVSTQQWGQMMWRQLASRPKRSLESIHLPTETMNDILSDVKWFLENRSWYERRGVPYRRGYIFYGKPGCGKSSFIFALAGYFDLPIAILDLTGKGEGHGGMISDAQLNMLVNAAPSKCILLAEEVDTLFTDKKEDKKDDDKAKNAKPRVKTDKYNLVLDGEDGPKKVEDKKDGPTADDIEDIDRVLLCLPGGGAAPRGDALRALLNTGAAKRPAVTCLLGLVEHEDGAAASIPDQLTFAGDAAGQTTRALLRVEDAAAKAKGKDPGLSGVLRKHGFDDEAKGFALPLDALRTLASEAGAGVQLTLSVADTKQLRKTYGKPGLGGLAKDLRELRARIAKEVKKLKAAEAGGEEKKEEKEEDEYKAEKSFRVPTDTCICTFQGMLNALDGVTAQEGRIVIFTTNRKERLDPALIRPGRMDRQFEFRNANIDQVRKMFVRFMRGVEVAGVGEASEEDVQRAAEEFADILSEGGREGGRTQFSLAQVQGYLTTKVREPNPLIAACLGAPDFFKLKTTHDAALPRQASLSGEVLSSLHLSTETPRQAST